MLGAMAEVLCGFLASHEIMRLTCANTHFSYVLTHPLELAQLAVRREEQYIIEAQWAIREIEDSEFDDPDWDRDDFWAPVREYDGPFAALYMAYDDGLPVGSPSEW